MPIVRDRQSVERVDSTLVALGSSSSGRPNVRHFPMRAFVSERNRAFGVGSGRGRVVVVVD